jgi:serine/threonine protein kinase
VNHPPTRSTKPPFDPKRYEVQRELGSGAAGKVYLVFDRETGEQLALKKLTRIDQRSVLRFKREFRSLANLHHTNLIQLYDLARDSDAWFLTMEYVEGRNLDEEFREAQPAHETRDQQHASASDKDADAAYFKHVTDLFQQLAAGVRAVHQAGMLHRDLKPSNVVVAQSGRVVVLDFGLVRELEHAGEGIRLTHDGTIAGTPAYMSPEQASAEPLSEASDWYSFGVMLYEMLSGRLPIDGRSPIDLIQRKLHMLPESLSSDSEGPRPLRELCMALLERNPAARPNGEQVIATLAELSPRARFARRRNQKS